MILEKHVDLSSKNGNEFPSTQFLGFFLEMDFVTALKSIWEPHGRVLKNYLQEIVSGLGENTIKRFDGTCFVPDHLGDKF